MKNTIYTYHTYHSLCFTFQKLLPLYSTTNIPVSNSFHFLKDGQTKLIPRNHDKLENHLQWRLLIQLLQTADKQTIDRFIYEDPVSTVVPLENAISMLLLQMTLQLQIARKRSESIEKKTPASQLQLSNICMSDVCRAIYAVKAMNLLITNCSAVRLVFEDTIFLMTLLLLSLHKALSEFERDSGISISGYQTVSSDVHTLFVGRK